MPQYFALFVAEQISSGVLLVPQSLPRQTVVEELLLMWVAMDSEEWVNRIMSLPL